MFDHQIALQFLELLDLCFVDEAEFDKDVSEPPLGIAALLAGRFLKLLHGDHLALDRKTTDQGYGLLCGHRVGVSAIRDVALSSSLGNYEFAWGASFVVPAKTEESVIATRLTC